MMAPKMNPPRSYQLYGESQTPTLYSPSWTKFQLAVLNKLEARKNIVISQYSEDSRAAVAGPLDRRSVSQAWKVMKIPGWTNQRSFYMEPVLSSGLHLSNNHVIYMIDRIQANNTTHARSSTPLDIHQRFRTLFSPPSLILPHHPPCHTSSHLPSRFPASPATVGMLLHRHRYSAQQSESTATIVRWNATLAGQQDDARQQEQGISIMTLRIHVISTVYFRASATHVRRG